MALPVQRLSQNEYQVEGFTTSIGASPVVAEIHAPYRGRITKVGVITAGVITTSNATCIVAIGGTAVTGGQFNIAVSGAAAGVNTSATPSGSQASSATAANAFVNEDDVISFT